MLGQLFVLANIGLVILIVFLIICSIINSGRITKALREKGEEE